MNQPHLSKWLIAFSLIFLTFTGGYALGQSRLAPVQLFYGAGTPNAAEEAFAPFWEVWRFVHEDYVDQPLDDIRLAEGAIEGMLATLDDPNTRYLSPEEEAATRQSMDGEFQGIGAQLENRDGNVLIVSPFEGSPAEEAGVKSGDIIRAVDGVSTDGMDAGEVASMIRGEAGSDVVLTMERDDQTLDITITRDIIELPSVEGEILDNGLAYLRLRQFGNNSSEELEEMLAELLAQNPAGLILDLRSNPGGNFSTAVEIADQFLPDGVVLTEEFGNGEERIFNSEDGDQAEEIPLVVLVDRGSASSSEVLAGALKDRSRAVIIGETSFGKGTVQTWKRLSNGGGVRITIARWLTPGGTWVHEDGIEPDYSVALEINEGEEFVDAQLEAAIDYLLEQN